VELQTKMNGLHFEVRRVVKSLAQKLTFLAKEYWSVCHLGQSSSSHIFVAEIRLQHEIVQVFITCLAVIFCDSTND